MAEDGSAALKSAFSKLTSLIQVLLVSGVETLVKPERVGIGCPYSYLC